MVQGGNIKLSSHPCLRPRLHLGPEGKSRIGSGPDRETQGTQETQEPQQAHQTHETHGRVEWDPELGERQVVYSICQPELRIY